MSAEIFETLESIHNESNQFFTKLALLKQVDESQSLEILAEANQITARMNGAYGEFNYLFEAANKHFGIRYNDFWDRIEKKGEYSDEEIDE